VSGSSSQLLWDVAARVPLILKVGSTAYVYRSGGLPLEQVNGSTVLWLQHDQLGSTRLATDSSWTTQATYTFDAYGEPTAVTGTITKPMQYGGHYRKAVPSMDYLQAR
jgi:hypothetical protein